MTEIETLVAAVQEGDVEAVRLITERDRNVVRQQDASGATALHYAAFNGSREIVSLLGERGADVNARDAKFGATPAGWAIEYLRELGGHLSIELEDLAHAIKTRDVAWAERFLTRFPKLRTGVYREQVTFRQLAVESADPRLEELFSDNARSAGWL